MKTRRTTFYNKGKGREKANSNKEHFFLANKMHVVGYRLQKKILDLEGKISFRKDWDYKADRTVLN